MSATALLLERYYAPAGGGDVTAPVLSSPTLTATGVGDTVSGTVSTDEGNGTLYWVITTSATPPSIAQIKAGQDHTGSAAAASGNSAVSSSGVQNAFSGESVTEGTSHWVYYVHTDAASNDSNIASTNATPNINPTLSSPTGAGTSPTAASGTVSTTEGEGTLYWIVDQSATPPSVAQIQAGNDSGGAAADASGNQAVSASGAQNVGTGGLAPSTTYYFYFQQADEVGNDSAVASSASFTTDAAGAAVFPTPYIHEAGPSRGRMLPYQQGGRHPTRG